MGNCNSCRLEVQKVYLFHTAMRYSMPVSQNGNQLLKITRNVFRRRIRWVDVWWKQMRLHFNSTHHYRHLKINNSTVALDLSYYRVYNGREYPADDRGNPKIGTSVSSRNSATMTRKPACKRAEQLSYNMGTAVEDDGLGDTKHHRC